MRISIATNTPIGRAVGEYSGRALDVELLMIFSKTMHQQSDHQFWFSDCGNESAIAALVAETSEMLEVISNTMRSPPSQPLLLSSTQATHHRSLRQVFVCAQHIIQCPIAKVPDVKGDGCIRRSYRIEPQDCQWLPPCAVTSNAHSVSVTAARIFGSPSHSKCPLTNPQPQPQPSSLMV